MRDKVFLDTNIIIYAYSEDEPEKRRAANLVFEKYSGNIIISNQVLNEFVNVAFRKLGLSALEIEEIVLELDSVFKIVYLILRVSLKLFR